MSKITVGSVRDTVDQMLEASQTKKRAFTETVELQIGLKNYDPQRDKRFSGSVKMPKVPRPQMSICILGDAHDIDRAKHVGNDAMSVEDLKKLNKNKKLVKVRSNSGCASTQSNDLRNWRRSTTHSSPRKS